MMQDTVILSFYFQQTFNLVFIKTTFKTCNSHFFELHVYNNELKWNKQAWAYPTGLVWPRSAVGNSSVDPVSGEPVDIWGDRLWWVYLTEETGASGFQQAGKPGVIERHLCGWLHLITPCFQCKGCKGSESLQTWPWSGFFPPYVLAPSSGWLCWWSWNSFIFMDPSHLSKNTRSCRGNLQQTAMASSIHTGSGDLLCVNYHTRWQMCCLALACQGFPRKQMGGTTVLE